MPRILFFRKTLVQEGGAERLFLEMASRARKFGFESRAAILVGDLNKIFSGHFAKQDVRVLCGSDYPKDFFSRAFLAFFAIARLRQEIKSLNPDFILAQGYDDVELLYFATLFTKYRYSTFIHQTFFWDEKDPLKYACIFRKHFKEIRDSLPGHREFIAERPPRLNLFRWLITECRALLSYFAVRKAQMVFVHSVQMGWEVNKMYGKDYVVSKTGIDEQMFGYVPKQDMKKKLGIAGKTMILDVSRLDPQKRLDLAIRTFGAIVKDFPEAKLVIGGRGADKERLEKIINELGLEKEVMLIGFVPEADLLDLYASAEVILHPAWVDFDVSFMEPLALGRKIVCSTEYDLAGNLSKLKNEQIFPANPKTEAMAEALKKALRHKIHLSEPLNKLLADYTWDGDTKYIFSYFGKQYGK